MDEEAMEVLAQNSLKACGRCVDHRTVRFGSGGGAHRLERMEVAVAHLGDEGTAVNTHAANRLGDPLRVAREEVLVLGGYERT